MTHIRPSCLFVLVALLVTATSAQGAVVTNVFKELFYDATLVAGLTNRNSTPISGGFADLNGSNANNTAQGFTFVNTPYAGSGPTVSFIMEAILGDAATATNNDTLFSFNGDIGLRRASGALWQIYRGLSTDSFTPPADGDHIALVFTENGASDVLDAYINSVLVASLNVNATINQSSNMGFGLETHGSVPISRGFDGSLDAIAFSTFTGTFNPAGDFALLVPEPSTLSLTFLGLAGLVSRRRSRITG